MHAIVELESLIPSKVRALDALDSLARFDLAGGIGGIGMSIQVVRVVQIHPLRLLTRQVPCRGNFHSEVHQGASQQIGSWSDCHAAGLKMAF